MRLLLPPESTRCEPGPLFDVFGHSRARRRPVVHVHLSHQRRLQLLCALHTSLCFCKVHGRYDRHEQHAHQARRMHPLALTTWAVPWHSCGAVACSLCCASRVQPCTTRQGGTTHQELGKTVSFPTRPDCVIVDPARTCPDDPQCRVRYVYRLSLYCDPHPHPMLGCSMSIDCHCIVIPTLTRYCTTPMKSQRNRQTEIELGAVLH